MAITPKARSKKVFMCGDCGHESLKWLGQCPGCKAWNTMTEVASTLQDARSASARSSKPAPKPMALKEAAQGAASVRLPTGITEFDFVLGGGVVQGSVIVLAGAPGVGKSTIALQTAALFHSVGHKVLYNSGEESPAQVAMRAKRFGKAAGDVQFVSETDIDALTETVLEFKPAILIVDSIQTMQSVNATGAPGMVSQVRECASALHTLAKEHNIAIFIIGHVTKQGEMAGPRQFEHLVDTVLYFEHVGDGEHRMVRAMKNRFGSVDEIAVFRMTETGLEAVGNPSELFLADRPIGVSGSAVTSVIEGTRPLLIEVQALVTPTAYNTPQRVATGFSRKRLALLVAILEKRAGLPFSQYDVFVNIVGGIDISDPATDAAVLAALVSSAYDAPLPSDTVFIGEVGLGGEMRRVSQLERRLSETNKLGFSKAFYPASQQARVPSGLGQQPVASLSQLLTQAIGWKPGKALPKTAQPPLAGALVPKVP